MKTSMGPALPPNVSLRRLLDAAEGRGRVGHDARLAAALLRGDARALGGLIGALMMQLS